MQPSDVELVHRSLAGDEDAARELVERYQRPVFNLLVRMVRDPATAEDLAQEAFVKAFAHLRSYDSRYKFSSWLFRIAHNGAIDLMRRPRPVTASLDAGEQGSEVREPASGEPSPFALAERSELAALLDSVIDGLRPEYREVVVLRYQEDMSYEDIAEALDKPLGTVKSDLHRARAELAVALKTSGWDRGGSEKPVQHGSGGLRKA